jgi:hypothetical protein
MTEAIVFKDNHQQYHLMLGIIAMIVDLLCAKYHAHGRAKDVQNYVVLSVTKPYEASAATM